jgi:alcohol dehydrogenase (cytochrome c)/quinohemoprotein ethanol dehydrogenase
VCHGESAISGGVIPDLRASGFLSNDFFYNIVLDGALQDAGMVSFKAVLSREDATSIRNYIIHRANQDKTANARRDAASSN